MQSNWYQIVALLLAVILAGYTEANTVKTCLSCRGIDCQRTTLNQTVQCTDPLDYCVTIYEHSRVEYKGCSLEIPPTLRRRSEANVFEIHKCNTDRCNGVGSIVYTCLQCDSSEDVNCAQNPLTLKASLCVAPTAPNSYCYVRSSTGGRVQRGCATSVVEQEECFADSNCMLCSPGDIRHCNNIPVA